MKKRSNPESPASVTFETQPIESEVAVLYGRFAPEERTVFDLPGVQGATRKAVREVMADAPLPYRSRDRRVVARAAEILERRPWEGNREQHLSFNSARRFRLTSGESRCVLCVGFASKSPRWSPPNRVDRDAFADFLKLDDPDACAAFARRWGLLSGLSQPISSYRLVEHREPFLGQDTWIGGRQEGPEEPDLSAVGLVSAKRLFEANLLPGDSKALKEGLRYGFLAEPLDAWLWHAARLRTWTKLMRISNTSRQVRILNRPIDLLRLPSPGMLSAGDHLEGWFVPELSESLVREAKDDEVEAVRLRRVWEYGVHQEGGFLAFAHPRFQALRELATKVPNAGFETELVILIRELLREQLAGKVHFQPFARDGMATVSPDSLLSWMYLEFSNRFADVLGGTYKSTPCKNPNCERVAIWTGKGRPNLYCSDSCKTLASRKRKAVQMGPFLPGTLPERKGQKAKTPQK